jgi:NADPH:quinone reductase-like Zn-dependent oxidoreductase
MNAIRIHERTGISGLVYEEAPDATPGLDDVLVKVAACGITHNELDWPIWTLPGRSSAATCAPAADKP